MADAKTHPARLIVVVAFSRAGNGQLVPAYDPMQFDTPEEATRMARYLSVKCAGVVAWVRDAQPDAGEYGPPTILFRSGDVPELE
ncbi:hypothetical protein [Phyllobacterium zundukense]|uniref:Uncharacterized protein n=1 Tax=Phyllobacterium zundukense TaxID=1867719 RepID=A0ACD4CY40_9HYPH|nr:hypothetical protein [Phyllobacterium zundukense]UXN58427.1 hypothetical protein N8E88_10290 [Phyllobacterium zundukense]